MEQQALIADDMPTPNVGPRGVVLDLPWPPSANHYNGQQVMLPSGYDIQREFGAHSDWKKLWHFIRKRSRVMVYQTDAAKEFHATVLAIAIRANARKNFQVPVRISMWVHPPDRRRRDISNLWKMVEDALVQSHVMQDDSLVHESHSYLSAVAAGGKVVVAIEPLV